MAHKYGDLLLARYKNFKLDPVPMVFVLYSDSRYTEGINSNYLTSAEVTYLRKVLYASPTNEGNKIYYYLKGEGSSILRAYRKYFSNLLFVLLQWHVTNVVEDKDLKKKMQTYYANRLDITQQLQDRRIKTPGATRIIG